MRLVVPAATVVALILLVGCSGDAEERPAAGGPTAESRILQPGQPGEGNETLAPDTTLAAPEFNDADAAFMQMMVPHHAQALEMTELAQTRASDESVASLARRIQGAQGPEIRTMAAWLTERQIEVPASMDDLHGTDHGSDPMMGMLTQGQMTQLAAARGAEFDRLFLAGMTQHHQGAVDMAGTELEEGSDQLALEMAADISTGQLAEIRRMADLRRRGS